MDRDQMQSDFPRERIYTSVYTQLFLLCSLNNLTNCEARTYSPGKPETAKAELIKYQVSNSYIITICKRGSMTPDNTIRAANNIDIYEHRIYSLFDEYKDTLSDNDKDCDIMIRNVRYFKGALKHIYLNLFKPSSCYDSTYNRYVTSILDYDDYNTLDYLWSIYTSLCYKYGIKPTVMNYSLMTGIEAETITNWSARLSDTFVGDMFQVNQDNKSRYPKDTQAIKGKLAKNWLKEQESALFDGASSGSVGDIFLLKAVYNYRDNTNITIDSNTSAEERRAIESDLIRRLTTIPDSAIQSSRDQETNTSRIAIPDADF